MNLNSQHTKKLSSFVRELRTEPESRAERRIWKTVLSKRQTGERFVRQETIGGNTVTFVCPDLKLVVEIEGASQFTHADYHVVRFSEDEIINRLEDVTEKMGNVIYALKQNC